MSSRKTSGRRRAVTVRTNPFAAISRAVAGNAGGTGRQAAVIAAASGMVLTSGIGAQAAEAPVQRDSAPASNLEVSSQTPAPLSADSSVRISFERPAVATAPAPVIEKPAPVIEKPAAAVEEPRPAAAAQAPAAKAQITVQPQAAAAPAAAPQTAGGVNAIMLSSAYAQLGITQDCTRLVEKALGAAGIPVGDIGPMAFMKYGKVVGAPAPGDMVVQSGHVGIFVGNGQVLSSGMNGKNQTVVHPLSWLTATGPVTFVRAGS
jgi:cell wall-associated NlpC family hydrolase